MTRHHSIIITLMFATFSLLVPQWFANQLSAAERTGSQPSLASPGDVRTNAESVNLSKPKAVVEADLRTEPAMDMSATKDNAQKEQKMQDRQLGYRPLCGSSKDAINHYACAPGYDSY
ncbi:MAG: hypothetical protein HOP00_05925 [Nitrospira sp.]|nr:hypothetical protein [Nitrospira sp.]